MDESTPETHGPQHHSYRLKPLIVILIGLVGGAGLYFGITAWYFTGVDPRRRTVGLRKGARRTHRPPTGAL